MAFEYFSTSVRRLCEAGVPQSAAKCSGLIALSTTRSTRSAKDAP
jgi:hypothetical protein